MNEQQQTSLQYIKSLLNARIPYIWVNTHEEDRFINNLLVDISDKTNRELWIWSSYHGLLKYNTSIPIARATGDQINTWTPNVALEYIHKYNNQKKGSIWIMKDFHTVLAQPIPRQLRDMYKQMITTSKTLIIVAPFLAHGPSGSKNGIEPTLDKQLIIVNYELPNRAGVEERLLVIIEKLKTSHNSKIKTKYTAEELEQCVSALQGLTEIEIDNAITTCICQLKRIDEKQLLKEKKQIIQKGEILEYVNQAPSINEVGGLDLAKKYFSTYNGQFSKEAREYGVDPLKGVILTGIPGCLDGDTQIYDPIVKDNLTVKERYEKGKSFSVISRNTNGHLIATTALAPVKYKPAKMIEFTMSNGKQITVTEQHKFLSEEKWVNASEVYEQLQEYGVYHLLSSLGTFQITILVQAKYIGEKEYYDFHVPIYNNYAACGLWHHNCGKSLLIKTIASLWNLPLIRLDMGRVMSSLVGSSEQKMREVISQVEAIAPCVTGDTTIDCIKIGENEYVNIPISTLYKLQCDLKITNIEVKTFNPVTKENEFIKLYKILEKDCVHNIIQIELDNGAVINVTENHKLLVKIDNTYQWVEASKLTEDMEIKHDGI